MFCLTNEKDISGDEPIYINYDQAVAELEKFPTFEEYEENGGPEFGPFIGFINQNDETIQFSTRDKENDIWIIDIPVSYKGLIVFIINFPLNSIEVRNIIKNYFSGSNNYKAFLNTERICPTVEEEIDNINSMEFGISYNVVKNYFFLANERDEVLAEIHIEEKELANELLVQIAEEYSAQLISVKKILDSMD